jgi:prepilin-type N-terminal cleavage/methylation domain-containing protein
MTKTNQSGFTLIEIAIVLVIIGLLLGGVLKGQELITSARVRNLIGQQDGIKAAFFGFQDRYRAYPGDYGAADTNLKCPTAPCFNGNGNGLIRSETTPTAVDERQLVWVHLASAGFLNGSYSMASPTEGALETNTPRNPYNTFLQFIHDTVYQDVAGTVPVKLNLKTGSQIPVEILAEVERKIDDGNGERGQFRFSQFDGGTGTPPVAPAATAACTDTNGVWLVAEGVANCGGASLF